MILRKCLSTVIFALALLPTVAHSAIITTYTDRSTFIAALNGLSTIEEDFNGQDLNLFTSAFNLDLGDFSVSSSDVASDQIGVVDSVDTNGSFFTPTFADSQSVDGSRFFGINGSDGGPSFNISFSTERFVFGFDWLDGDVTDSYAMTVLGQVFESAPFDNRFVDAVPRGFFGIISDTAFDNVEFYQTDAGGYIAGFGVDNLITSGIDIVTCSQDPTLPECAANAVPEPSSMAIIGLGLIGLASRRRIKL
ncbi:PEP-CTERM sorting domain-containing protein [Alteromonas sp. MB-3u-76]|uniref:PEP-CTERM sorting domain-containing protein n=1 Tax=unclassified Alteromonas TaxID=2614992 RepID=UPI000903A584|nr:MULTISPECIES: PEP-CTERM sorting domain-containing protein [unclassified Alteromonas]APE06502.1 hypothetical protein BM528_12605 [Alteromonas sp. RW2A1]AUC89044.1 PEP-CTERM sorting domain-containing protein [Alteromonas sp. MB-3u-76]